MLVHLGYLAVKEVLGNGQYVVYIPNEEIKDEFNYVLENNKRYNDVFDLVKDTDNLLKNIWNKEEKEVAKAFDRNHQKYSSIIKYNDENTLANVIALFLLLSTAIYSVKREASAGKGFADFICLKNINLSMLY